jgi:D-lactate dehydrogenase (quinone)
MLSNPVPIQSQGNAARSDNPRFIEQLKSIVAPRHVLTKPGSTLRYRVGFRFGDGPVLAVVRPGNLVEQWRVLKLCVAANKIIIMQAANTGLTGGSTPDGSDYDRDIEERLARSANDLQTLGDIALLIWPFISTRRLPEAFL